MGQEIEDSRVEPFGWLPIRVLRNAYGSQVYSFRDVGKVSGLEGHPEMEMVFIRAPRFELLSKEVRVLGTCRGETVLVCLGHHVGAAFHPSSQTTRAYIDSGLRACRPRLPSEPLRRRRAARNRCRLHSCRPGDSASYCRP